MDRHSLLDDDDTTPTRERENVFSDEFEDELDFNGVADGFRPNMDREGHGVALQDSGPVRTVSAQHTTHPITPTTSRGSSRNSTQKPRGQANPFASPEDDEDVLRDRPHNLEFEPDSMARRSTSSASSDVFARTNSVRFGAGPSHPYGMYQQGTVARTPSVATTSTIRPPPRQSFTQNAPQHPYALYPQGVDDETDDEEDIQPVPQNPVPVGFPGLGQGYTRRIGPDGEDQDIVGEDGHTEQLPPYSRYPEDGPEKMPLLVPTALHSRAPVAGTDPGMPLMHDALRPTRTPVPQSMTDVSELDRHASRSSMAHLALISSSSSNYSSTVANKKWKEMTWKERRETRICGIPFWWAVIAICILVFVAAVLGGAIGGFVAGGDHARDNAAKAVTKLFDASPIASPTGVNLPQGTFALTLGLPQESQCDCLTDPSQLAAWSCNLAPNPALGLVVSPGTGNGSGASVFYASYDTAIAYGAQLSNMNTSFAQFIPVTDNDDPEDGPAFYFQQYYDKIVVVPDDQLSMADSSGGNKRRQTYVEPGFMLPGDWHHRNQVISPGEKPWFCVWNGTFLEGFIYVQRPVSTSTTSSSSQTSPPTDTGSSALYSSNSPTTSPAPTSPPDSTSVLSATHGGPVTGYQASHSDNDDGSYKKRQMPSTDLWDTLNTFPYVIKLEERRLPNNPTQPYCQQYQILNSGAANWVPDAHGNPIKIYLQEQDPDLSKYQTSKRNVPDGCHCQWMSGQ